MTFTIPDLTALLVVVLAVAVVAVAGSAVTLGGALVQHRAVRIRRREGVVHYYGHLVLGH